MTPTLFFLAFCYSAAAVLAGTHELNGVRVLVTAPTVYANRLIPHLESAGATVIHCPTIVTELFTDDEEAGLSLRTALTSRLGSFDYIAFTSRRGIEAALRVGGEDLVRRLNEDGNSPSPIVLGADRGALEALGVRRSSILVPEDASPNGIVQFLSEAVKPEERSETYVLCPVPLVTGGLREPPVVPGFLSSLSKAGFSVDRCNAYRTRLMDASKETEAALKHLKKGNVDVVAFSSTAEVEGLLLLCSHCNMDLHRCRASFVSHGPVTAAGAEALGIKVKTVSSDYSSFEGMIDAVARCMKSRRFDEHGTKK